MGLTQEEIGQELGLSTNTVGRRWQTAKQWLHHELQPSERTG